MTRTLTLPLRLAEATDAADPAPAPLEERALAGDAAAWEALFRRHNRRVVLVLLSRGVRADVARDLAQDAWTRLIEKQRRGQLHLLRLPALAIRQALFLAADRARRGDVRCEHVVLSDDAAEAGDFDLGKQLADRSRLARARAVLATCSDSQQRVFRAIYARPGVSAAEVAAETRLSVQRVRQIMCEVRKKLRAVVEDVDV